MALTSNNRATGIGKYGIELYTEVKNVFVDLS